VIPAEAPTVPDEDASNMVAGAKVGGGGFELDPQTGTFREHKVSVNRE